MTQNNRDVILDLCFGRVRIFTVGDIERYRVAGEDLAFAIIALTFYHNLYHM